MWSDIYQLRESGWLDCNRNPNPNRNHNPNPNPNPNPNHNPNPNPNPKREKREFYDLNVSLNPILNWAIFSGAGNRLARKKSSYVES